MILIIEPSDGKACAANVNAGAYCFLLNARKNRERSPECCIKKSNVFLANTPGIDPVPLLTDIAAIPSGVNGGAKRNGAAVGIEANIISVVNGASF